jgi:capsid protein
MATDRSVFDGVQYDSFGRPIAFYVLSDDDTVGVRSFRGSKRGTSCGCRT